MQTRWVRLVGWVLLGGVSVGLGGCEAFGFLAYGLSSGEVKAEYRLADRATVVMVDDPSFELGEPGLAALLGSRVGYHLVENKAVSERHLVSQNQLAELAGRLGQRYAQTPMDEVGREVGAKQVVHVYVESVVMEDQVGVLRPRAVVTVKLVEAKSGKRLYPARSRGEDFLEQSSGRAVNVKMFYRAIGMDDRASVGAVKRELIEKVALETAQLFYDHDPEDPGNGPGSGP